ncbi:MAG TPA: helix-turn-helix domain-containing protein [Tepidisphaeraceae bacterium]|nr:helix-turn-helix domain-containing protein [Tepidisphaeraceae bacterium]
MTPTRKARQERDAYMALIQELPLKKIRNDREHTKAIAMVSRLMGRDLDTGSADYLDTLLILVNQYEDEHHAIDENMTPQQALRALMEANHLKQADIGRIIGSESGVSMFLKGARELSKAQILKLSTHFNVDPRLFMRSRTE